MLEIRAQAAEGRYSTDEIAKKYGVSRVTIERIIRRETWTKVL